MLDRLRRGQKAGVVRGRILRFRDTARLKAWAEKLGLSDAVALIDETRREFFNAMAEAA